jgi:hypothetical protein
VRRNHLGGAYGVSLLRAMGSTNYYNALPREKTGDFWVNGRLFGAQTCDTGEEVENTDLLVVIGCNPLAGGTPHHKNVRVRLRLARGAETAAEEERAQRVLALAAAEREAG